MTDKAEAKSTAFLVTATEGSTARTEAPTLTAGRELDALIAEKVMGYMAVRIRPENRPWEGSLYDDDGILLATPNYSADIAAAAEVLQKLREDGWSIDIRIDDEPWDSLFVGPYSVVLLGCNRGRTDATDIRATADTLPLAISLAASRAGSVLSQTEKGK